MKIKTTPKIRGVFGIVFFVCAVLSTHEDAYAKADIQGAIDSNYFEIRNKFTKCVYPGRQECGRNLDKVYEKYKRVRSALIRQFRFLVSSDPGNGIAKYLLAEILLEQGLTRENKEEVLSLLKSSSDSTFGLSLNLLGDVHASGQLGNKKRNDALSFYRQAADEGLVYAMIQSARILFSSTDNISDSQERAIEYIEVAANSSTEIDPEKDMRGLNRPSSLYAIGHKDKIRILLKQLGQTESVENAVLSHFVYSHGEQLHSRLLAPLSGPIHLYKALRLLDGPEDSEEIVKATVFYAKKASSNKVQLGHVLIAGFYEHGFGVTKSQERASISWGHAKSCRSRSEFGAFDCNELISEYSGYKSREQDPYGSVFNRDTEKAYDRYAVSLYNKFGVGEYVANYMNEIMIHFENDHDFPGVLPLLALPWKTRL